MIAWMPGIALRLADEDPALGLSDGSGLVHGPQAAGELIQARWLPGGDSRPV